MPGLPRTFILATLITLATPAAWGQLNMTQVGTLHPYTEYSDVWGYSDGVTELAILGTLDGTSFIDATNPASPVEIAFIPGPNSIWRDIKTYSTYAYITNETSGGLQVVDLSNPLSPVLVKSDSVYFDTAHNCFADSAEALLYVCGTNSPGMVIFDLTDPANPTYVSNYTDVYVHDLYVENQIGYLADVYSGRLRVVDFSALPAWTTLDFGGTVGGFCHNTWLTDDGQYCLTTDENSGGHIQVWDVSTPTSIFPVSEWEHQDDPASIVHNVTVKGDYAFVSWYRTGVQVLDLSNPLFPQRVGYFDTYPGSGNGFNGNWGVYPYQPSGNIYLSDLESGLFILSFNPVFGHIEGVVEEAGNAALLENVSCAIASENNTVFTLSTGGYRFSLPPGAYEVAYSKFAFFPDTAVVAVADGVISIQNISLVRQPDGSLGGNVNVHGQYAPVAGAQVLIDGTPLATLTDAGGNYFFSQIPEGTWTVMVEEFGYAPVSQVITITENQHTTLNLSLILATYAWDLESASGWTIGVAGDTAIRGNWELAAPEATGSGQVQPGSDHSDPGTLCFVTQAAAGGGIGSFDVDGGTTTVMSPTLDLTGLVDPALQYYRWYTNNSGANAGSDLWLVEISDDGGSNWVALESTMVSDASWTRYDFNLTDFISPGNQVVIRWIAEDADPGSVVEALVDDISIYAKTVVGVGDETPTVKLLPAARNPFQGETALRFTMAGRRHVRVDVFDVNGRRVVNLVDAELDEGLHVLPWSGRNQKGQSLASGMYFVRYQVGDSILRQKLVKTP